MSRAGYDMQTRQRLAARVIGGERISDVCRESGVSYSALHSWVKDESHGWNPRGENCPRCGATPSNQKYKVAKIRNAGAADHWMQMNPVDGFVCPYCDEAFRVRRLEYEDGYIIDWQVEFEFSPNFCPKCGANLDGKLSTDAEVEG